MSDELEKKEPGLEERFAKIDAILDAMEDENVTLDRSFALYKEGLEQIKAAFWPESKLWKLKFQL